MKCVRQPCQQAPGKVVLSPTPRVRLGAHQGLGKSGQPLAREILTPVRQPLVQPLARRHPRYGQSAVLGSQDPAFDSSRRAPWPLPCHRLSEPGSHVEAAAATEIATRFPRLPQARRRRGATRTPRQGTLLQTTSRRFNNVRSRPLPTTPHNCRTRLEAIEKIEDQRREHDEDRQHEYPADHGSPSGWGPKHDATALGGPSRSGTESRERLRLRTSA